MNQPSACSATASDAVAVLLCAKHITHKIQPQDWLVSKQLSGKSWAENDSIPSWLWCESFPAVMIDIELARSSCKDCSRVSLVQDVQGTRDGELASRLNHHSQDTLQDYMFSIILYEVQLGVQTEMHGSV